MSISAKIAVETLKEVSLLTATMHLSRLRVKFLTPSDVKEAAELFVETRGDEPIYKCRYGNDNKLKYSYIHETITLFTKLNNCIGIYHKGNLLWFGIFSDAIFVHKSHPILKYHLLNTTMVDPRFKNDFPELYTKLLNNKYNIIKTENYGKLRQNFKPFEILCLHKIYVIKNYQNLGLGKLFYLVLYILSITLGSKYCFVNLSNRQSYYSGKFDMNYGFNYTKFYGEFDWRLRDSYYNIEKYFDENYSKNDFMYYWNKIVDVSKMKQHKDKIVQNILQRVKFHLSKL